MAPFLIGCYFEISTKQNLIHHLKAFPKCIHSSKSNKNAKTIGQKRKCTRWCHFGLAAILSRQTSEISYIISKHFQNVFTFKNRFKTAKVIEQTTNFQYHTLSLINSSSYFFIKTLLP
jgi:hypothetical protein